MSFLSRRRFELRPILLILLISCMVPWNALAAGTSQALSLQDGKPVTVADHVLLFADPSGRLGPSEVLSKRDSFAKVTYGELNREYSNTAYWLLIDVANEGVFTDWHLASLLPLINLEVYRISSNGLVALPGLDLRIPASPLNIAQGETATFLLKVSSHHVANLQFQILRRNELYARDRSEGMFFALICGCFLAMIIYNLFLYLTLRDVNYLYYLLFAAVNSHLNMLSIKFPDGVFGWGGIDWWSFIYSYSPLAPLTTFLFVKSFLQTKMDYPGLNRVFVWYMGGLLLLSASQLGFPSSVLVSITDIYFIFGLGILVAAGVIALRDGFTPSRYYLASLAIYFAGMFIYLLMCQGLIATNLFTLNAHIVAQACEMLFMSLALGGKIKMLEQDNIRTKVTAEVKGRLLRVISHDIANPLSVVKATAYYLQSRPESGGRMPMILRAVGMIEDIMKFVLKSESLGNGKAIPLEPVAIQELFESLAFLFNDKASEKGVRLEFSQSEPHLKVRAEPTSLRSEVMSNFLSNAIKFSFPSGTVRVMAEPIGEANILITVEDKGTGMNENTVASLFDAAENLSRAGTHGERGTGYGMPLAKAYLDTFHASVIVESISIDQDSQSCGTRIRATFQRDFSDI